VYVNVWEHLRYLYIQNVYLTERLAGLEQQILTLSQRMEQGATKEPCVQKIEYRFDQLKIDTLQGTLHIGVKPGQHANDDDWTLNEIPLPDPGGKATFPTIHAHVHRYVTESVPSVVQQQAEVIGIELEPEEMERIVGDLRSQVDARIAHYMKVSEVDPTQDPQTFERHIAERTIQDIDTAVRTFMGQKSSSEKRGNQ
jgi:spore germination protein PC